ncbi:universal stress protein [Azospirillum sp. ST 5-10]|uniref:universal stress protein n=1 Tax=unclassified Azospirillum TaxID=2630922 RepID=UPI003F4A030A
MRSVLLATDLTAQSDRALARAVRLAGPTGSLTVLHTVEDADYTVADDDQCRKAEARLERLLQGHRAAEGCAVSLVVRTGDPAEEIVGLARSGAADVVVLGTHRASLLGDLFGSATAQRVADAGSAPVLTVKDPVVGDYRSLVVGIDDSDASERALAAALTLFPETRVTVVHAFHVPFGGFLDSPDNRDALAGQQRAALGARIRNVGRRIGRPELADRIDLRLRDGDTIAVLDAEVGHGEADLLVLGTSGSGNRLFGGVASAVAGSPPCDLLIVPCALPS